MDANQKLQELKEALRASEEKVRQAPEDLNLRFDLAKLYYLASLNDKSLELFKALSGKGDLRRQCDVNFYLGRLRMRQNDYNAAITDFYKAMSQTASMEMRMQVGHSLVQCLMQEGWVDEALRIKRQLGL